MSLKVHVDRDRGSRTVSDKDKVKSQFYKKTYYQTFHVQGKYSSRHSGDLRAMLSKDRRDRDRDGSRERERHSDRERERGRVRSRRHSSSNNGGALRDRLTDKYKDSDCYNIEYINL